MLAVAAAHADHCLGVLLSAPPDHRPVLFIRYRGNRAGVDHIAVTLPGKIPDLMSHGGKELLHCLGLILVYLAAQGIKSKFHSKIHQKCLLCFVKIVRFVY